MSLVLTQQNEYKLMQARPTGVSGAGLITTKTKI